MVSRPLQLPDYRAMAQFRYEIRRFLAFSERAARAAGLEPQQYQVMMAVKGLPEGARPTIRFLAERMQLRHHSTVALVNRLAAKDLVVRQRSDADRREVLVRLTPEGERLLEELARAHRAEIVKMGPALVDALQRLIPNLESAAALAEED